VTEIADRFRRRSAAFTERVDAVPDDAWDNPSPCKDWVARDIVDHMVKNAHLFYSLVGRELPPGPSVADDPAAAWAYARDAIQGGLDDPEIAQLEYDGQMGRGTFESGVDRFGSPDVVIHTWDLARAAHLDERLDAADVHAVYESMRGLGEVLRTSGAFGPAVEPPAGADEQTRLLAFCGRRV
jgi:uncharacterized protein (TIGR03086 family)